MIEDDWPDPGFDNSLDPHEFLDSDPVSSTEESLALGQEEPFYRRKPRIIWFREGVDGLEKGWEDLEYKAENLPAFAAAFEAEYYSKEGVFGDTENPDFYYLRQGDIIVGTDTEGTEVVALVGEVEPNVRGQIQKPVPKEKFTFSVNMEREGMPSSHVLTFLTQAEGGCPGPCEGSNQEELGSSDSWSQDSPLEDSCGATFEIVTDITGVADPYGGHTLTVKKRTLTLNDCGDVVRVGEEIESSISFDGHVHEGSSAILTGHGTAGINGTYAPDGTADGVTSYASATHTLARIQGTGLWSAKHYWQIKQGTAVLVESAMEDPGDEFPWDADWSSSAPSLVVTESS